MNAYTKRLLWRLWSQALLALTVLVISLSGAQAQERVSKRGADVELERQLRLIQEPSSSSKRARASRKSREATASAATLEAQDQPVTLSAAGGSGAATSQDPLGGRDPHSLNPTLKVGLLLLLLGLLPAILVSVTSFMRIVVVLGFVRQALGTQSLPPNQVLIGLSLFLCLFTMGPTLQKIETAAVTPYMAGELNDFEAIKAAEAPLREFMIKHTCAKDLKLFVGLSQQTKPASMADISTFVLIPSFMLSELRTAFLMGALIYLPFVLVDLVVSTVLMSMGMMMVPPAMIAMPIKLLLFVLVDGWTLVVGSLARSIMA